MKGAGWLAACAALTWAGAALAGDPETCAYADARLAEACATNPDVRAYLLEPYNVMVERYLEVPPAVRGWEPGEEDVVIRTAIRLAAQAKAGCGFDDPVFARACMLDPVLRAAAREGGLKPSDAWFHLPFDIAGWAPNTFDRRRLADNPGATRQRVTWALFKSRSALIHEIERAISRAVRQEVVMARLYLVAVDGRNFVACGYGFFDGGGYEPPSAGLVVFDTQGGSALRAERDHFNGLCGLSDAVLR